MVKKIVILTGSETRHSFFRKFIANSKNIIVLASYCESPERGLLNTVKNTAELQSLKVKHLLDREKSENDFFDLFNKEIPDASNPIFIETGHINKEKSVKNIINLNPDLIVSFGCSIIKSDLLKIFKDRFINVHLGLSPYYRGSGTNYWPMVNNEPEYIGATFMHIDKGIDTGEIIHQIRADFFEYDTPAQIGNRFIKKMSITFRKIIEQFDYLENPDYIDRINYMDRFYKNKDYTEESVVQLYANFSNGMIDEFINNSLAKCKKVPIIENSAMVDK
jgi:phosphoribosylglycinamide formyltransferase 1